MGHTTVERMGTTRSRLSTAAVLAGGLLVLPLTGCTGDEANTGSSVLTTASDAAGTAAESAAENVDCSGDSCSVTLGSGSGETEVLGVNLSYDSFADGEATVRVGEETVTCSEGESVSAGPLQLECTTISEDSLTLTATLS